MMNELHLREVILALIGKIAPEADLTGIEADARFRDQFAFDSIDCLNLINGIVRETGVEIPEEDYPQLGTLNGCIRYLDRRLEAR